jgi:trehalose 6-phosphate synthase
MNLVAKEGAIVGKETMVQILGQNAGVAEEFGEASVLIEPDDTESFADAFYEAYHMPEDARRERKRKIADDVLANDVFDWWAKRHEPVFQQVWNEKAAANDNTPLVIPVEPESTVLAA